MLFKMYLKWRLSPTQSYASFQTQEEHIRNSFKNVNLYLNNACVSSMLKYQLNNAHVSMCQVNHTQSGSGFICYSISLQVASHCFGSAVCLRPYCIWSYEKLACPLLWNVLDLQLFEIWNGQRLDPILSVSPPLPSCPSLMYEFCFFICLFPPSP